VTDEPGPPRPADRAAGERVPASAGLCATCIHARLIVNARGSRFVLCGRSRTDPRFPRYPPLPVRACAGFEPAPGP
jgi:hypothetical protein